MATSISCATPSLPRFLLPRLSWGGYAVSSHLPRAATLPHDSRQPWQPFFPPSSSPVVATTIHTIHPSRGTPRCVTPKIPMTKSPILNSPGLRRSFHATVPRGRDHHFDTLKFVQRLQSEGFTEEQSVAMMRTLNDVIEER